tara:strand:- start:140 stop:589 length:450 start_codon:yes stop_codon:yes gene_type:complete
MNMASRVIDVSWLTVLRAGAWVIDNVVILFIGIGVHVVFLYLWTVLFGLAAASVNMLLFGVCQCITKFFYLILLERKYGFTLGKRVLGLRVVDRHTGALPSLGKVIARTLLFGLHYVTYGVTFFFIILNKHNLQVHELFSGTVVERAKE